MTSALVDPRGHDIAEEAYEAALEELAAEFYADPYRFVLTAYPWGEPWTTLERHDGPDTWQRTSSSASGRRSPTTTSTGSRR